MTHLEGPQSILKTDSRGRVQTPPQRREALLDEFERSGLSGRKFAELVGVVPVTFSAWVCQRRRKQAQAKSLKGHTEPIALLEAVLEERSSPLVSVAQRVVIELGGGAKVEVGTREQLVLVAELVGLLSERTAGPSQIC